MSFMRRGGREWKEWKGNRVKGGRRKGEREGGEGEEKDER